MEINSSLFGKQSIDPNTIINFPNGIPGFKTETQFKLFHQEGKPVVFWLQSLKDEQLTFSVAPPSLFNIDYNFTLTDEDEQLLQLNQADEVIILILLHANDEQSGNNQLTIKGSIKAPLVINTAKRIGFQKVLQQMEQSITLTETSNNQIVLSEGACAA